MAVVRRKIARSSRKTTCKNFPSVRAGRPCRGVRLPKWKEEFDRRSRRHSSRAWRMLKGMGTFATGVAAVFVQSFLHN